MSTQAQFILGVYGPLPNKVPLPSIGLPPEVALSWTSEIPGGWGNAQIGILDEAQRHGLNYAELMQTFLPEPVDVRPKSHVEITTPAGAKVWEGRVEADEMVGNDIRGLDCDGYGIAGMGDDWFRGGATTEEATSGRIARSIIGSHAPLISIGEFADPGTVHPYSDYQRMTPFQALNAMADEGGGDNNNPWIWYVYNRTLHFVEKVAPAVPEYRIPYDRTVTRRREHRGIFSHGSMYYRDPDGTDHLSIEYSKQATVNLLEFEIHKLIEGGVSSSSGAVQFIETALQQAVAPQPYLTIMRQWDERGMETTTGGERPAYLVEAGQWVGIDDSEALLIEFVRNDGRSRQTNITVGVPPVRSARSIFQRLLKGEEAVRTARDIKTGMKWGR